MRTYEFTVILSADPTDESVNQLYGHFGAGGDAPDHVQSVVIGTRAGLPYAGCTVRADSFETALRAVLPVLQRQGLDVQRVEVEKEDLMPLLAA